MGAEQLIAEGMALTKRECGECSLCCKLLRVPDLNKEQNVWCQHCKPGDGGCSIYLIRPQVCRTYACMWLTMPHLGDEWFPAECGMVLDLGMHDEEGLAILRVHVDEANPDRWREEPYYTQIRRMAMIGLMRTEQHFQTVVSSAGRKWIVLPDREVDAAKPGLLLRRNDGKFEYTECENRTEVRRLGIRKVVEATADRALKEFPDQQPNEIVKRMAEFLEK